MSEDEKKVHFSYARTVDTDFPRSKVDDASDNLKEQYAKAKGAPYSPDQPPPPGGPPAGSQMVRDDKPPLQPTPSGAMRQGADRESYNERLAQERRAAELNQKAISRKAQQKQLELKNDREKDNDDRSR